MSAMSFDDLPPNARDIPLTDRRIAADTIDLIVSLEDRAHGCLGVMVCDDQHRGIQPIVLSDVPADAGTSGLESLLHLLLPLVHDNGGSLLVSRGRPRGAVPNDIDRAWHQKTIDMCAAHGVPLLGFYLATYEGVFALPEPLVAAS